MNNLSLTDVKFVRQRLASAEDSRRRREESKTFAPSSSKTKEKGKKGKDKGKGKKGKKKSKKELEDEAAHFILHQRKNLLKNYSFACDKLKIDPDEELLRQMNDETIQGPLTILTSDGIRLGPGNTRALCCGISGKWLSTTIESKMFGSEYQFLLHLGINNGDIGSTGCRAIACLLSSSSCTLQTLRLHSRNNIGAHGCAAIGTALNFGGGNKSLIELYLDGDTSVGDAGVVELCSRLELNSR